MVQNTFSQQFLSWSAIGSPFCSLDAMPSAFSHKCRGGVSCPRFLVGNTREHIYFIPVVRFCGFWFSSIGKSPWARPTLFLVNSWMDTLLIIKADPYSHPNHQTERKEYRGTSPNAVPSHPFCDGQRDRGRAITDAKTRGSEVNKTLEKILLG